MHKLLGCLLIFTLLSAYSKVYAQHQQDVDFHLNAHILNGQKILKVKRDFHDIYLWVLAANNQVFRVNSTTLAIDDYSSKFSAYSRYNFVDIVGFSADTVFIATNTPDVIEYLNGPLKIIGAGDGIPGNVNSLGINLGYGLNLAVDKGQIMIATNLGLRLFDVKTQKMGTLPDAFPYATDSPRANTRIYQSTYRTENHEDSIKTSASSWDTDTIHFVPVTFDGEHIYDQAGGILMTGYVWQSNYFGQHLNTVLSLLPSAGFTSDEYFSENFWGNERGLFQIHWDYSQATIYQGYEHYLDGIKVNKISDILGLTSFSRYYGSEFIKQTLLIGTDNGFYFSSSVYNPYGFYPNPFSLFHYDELGNIKINDIYVNAVPDADPVCENGVWLATNNGVYLLKPDYGKYFGNQQREIISFKHQADTLSQLQLCSQQTAVASAGGGYPNIQWYKDGLELPGQSNDTLAIAEAGEYHAVIYDPCEGLHAESNHLQVKIIATPVFTFDYPDELNYCKGSTVSLLAKGTSYYKYRWYKNDTLTNITGNQFDATLPGRYKVEVSACPNSWVPSKEVQINFHMPPQPVVEVNKPVFCLGDNAVLKVSATAGTNFTIDWYLDGVLLPNDAGLETVTTNVAGSYNAVFTSKTTNTDGSYCTQASNTIAITFNNHPVAIIKEIVNITLCDGQTITLSAISAGNTFKWSTGETTSQINVTAPGNYSVMATNAAGCTTDASIDISFLANPILNLHDTTICVYQRRAVTLTAPPGFAKYVWNNVAGHQTFDVALPQTVHLTVTDNNGCTAAQTVTVTEKCGLVYIPNTFTPNGDGINDLWDIQGLDNTSVIKVFNRYGLLIYQNKGYSAAWDGRYNGKPLPQGVYYYLITAKYNQQTFSGSITIIY
jgi:gliding motility-associated-like protein